MNTFPFSLILLLLVTFFVLRRRRSLFTSVKIPKVVHKIFLNKQMNPQPIEGAIQRAMDTWTTLNPGYTLKFWWGEDCRNYLFFLINLNYSYFLI